LRPLIVTEYPPLRIELNGKTEDNAGLSNEKEDPFVPINALTVTMWNGTTVRSDGEEHATVVPEVHAVVTH
jgi:hypothetical protein